MKIKIFTTGGTIDKTYFDQKSEYQIGDPQAKGVLEKANVVVDYEVESILKKDSLDLTDSDRELIRKKVESTPFDKIIVRPAQGDGAYSVGHIFLYEDTY